MNTTTTMDRIPFVLYTSMGLPIPIAVSHYGVETARMSTDVAAALVGAGIVSVLVFPALALRFSSPTGRSDEAAMKSTNGGYDA